jgi:cysteinyl-tRNA synthetase
MLDDLNTPGALAAVFEGTRLVLSRLESGGPGAAGACRDWLRRIDDLLGVVYPSSPGGARSVDAETEEIEALVAERTKARAEKNFARADEIRKKLEALGVEVMDTPRGPKWKRISALD